MALRNLRWLAVVVLVIGYAALAHYTNQSPHVGRLGTWVALAPVVLIAVALAWRSSQRGAMLSVIALCGVALWLTWPALEQHYGMLYWLQHVGMQLILLAVFGRTLIGGREPLCTRFARVVHAPLVLSPKHERYTRHVTLAWTVFFAAMALLSTGLFLGTPLATWSFFANFLTLPLAALVFVAEYRLRAWALPEVPPVPLLDGVRAFAKNSGQPR